MAEPVKKQVISKNGVIYCTTSVPYPPHIVKQMKQAGYKVKEITEEDDDV